MHRYSLFFFFLLIFSITHGKKDSLLNEYKKIETTIAEDSQMVSKLGRVIDKLKYIAPDTATFISRKGVRYSRTHNNIVYEGFFYKYIGDIKWHLGQLDSSIHYYQIAHDLYQKHNLREDRAYMLCDMGYTYMDMNRLEKALSNYYKAMDIASEDSLPHLRSLALAYIAPIHAKLEQYEKAIDIYQKALDYYRKTGNQRNMAKVMHNIGGLYVRLEKLPEALEYYKNSLQLKKKSGDEKGIAITLMDMSSVNLGLNNFNKALKNLNRSAEIFRKIKAPFNLIQNHIALGQTHIKLRNYDKALQHLYIAEELAVKNKAINSLTSVYREISEIHKRNGNFEKALEFHEKQIDIKDSIQKINNQKQLNKLAAEYEAEQKELKISNLEKEKKLQNERLKKENTQKIAFASGFLMALIAAFLILRSYRQKKKVNEQLHDKNKLISQQKEEVEHQKTIVEEKNKEITDSITYARRLQSAILPPDKLVREWLPESFILYKPKDIVAGDFYWMESLENRDIVLFAAADCTGHGVPGAMVSVVCNNALNRTVNEFNITRPDAILEKVRELVESTFEKSEEDVKDGMDIALCALNLKTNELHYAGANNPLYILRNNEILETKPDKQPIGKYAHKSPFTNHVLQLQKGDAVYVFSDGYPDQFGGPKGKKLKYKNFKKLLISINDKSMHTQREELNAFFENWKGDLEQLDDVCVIGVRG